MSIVGWTPAHRAAIIDVMRQWSKREVVEGMDEEQLRMLLEELVDDDITEDDTNSEILEWIDQDDLIEAVLYESFYTTEELLEFLSRPEYAEIRHAHALDESLEPVLLCGGTRTPQAERAFYQRVMQGF